MSLLFTHLIEQDLPSFSQELKRDPTELADCWEKVIEMQSVDLVSRFEQFVTTSTGKKFSFENILRESFNQAIVEQHPKAQAGDTVSLKLDGVQIDVIVGKNQAFGGQTIEQISRAVGVPEAEVKAFAFKKQLDQIGTRQRANHLDITKAFWHPLSEYREDGDQLWMNLHATASMTLNAAYLDTAQTDDGGTTARSNVAALLGEFLTLEIEQNLRDRHNPTIYLVCTKLVNRLEIEFDKHPI